MSIRWMDGRKLRKDSRNLLLKMGYTIYDKVRRRLAQDHNWKCYYCEAALVLITDGQRDRNLATIDHKTPISRGGTFKKYNLACACRRCNEEKANMTEDEYRFYLYLTRGKYGY